MEDTNTDLNVTIKPSPRCVLEFHLMHVEQPEIVSTLSKVILSPINLEAKMDMIRSFPKRLKLRRTFPDSFKQLEQLEPGTAFIFEVDVVCKNNKLQVVEKVRSDDYFKRWSSDYETEAP